MNYARTALFVTVLASLLVVGCNKAYYDNIDRGAGYQYRPGYPELRLASTGYVDIQNNTFIVVTGDVVYGSLIYSGKDGINTAKVNIEIQIALDNETKDVVNRAQFTETISDESPRIKNSQEVFTFEREFETPPGNYIVQAVITDESSNQQTVRTTKTSIPNPSGENSHITEIQILTKNSSASESSFKPATTYDIPSRFDSLKFVFQVTNNNPDEPIEINSRLLKFRSDTSIARPMSFSNYTSSSLPHVGVDYDRYDVIQSSTRQLNQPGSVIIEFSFADLSRGNYRLEVVSNEGTDNELFRGRDFGIKSPNYPSLKTPRELARPLYYIMNQKEYDRLIQINDPDSLKNAIDRFWLSNIGNSNIARNVISLYYERVEEANKQFSNFKEGWKTDPGMMYILFGPPWYNDVFGDEMVWGYSYNRDDPEKNFLFERTKLNSKYFPFNNYLLQRNHFYHSIWYEQTERWRSGNILRTNL